MAVERAVREEGSDREREKASMSRQWRCSCGCGEEEPAAAAVLDKPLAVSKVLGAAAAAAVALGCSERASAGDRKLLRLLVGGVGLGVIDRAAALAPACGEAGKPAGDDDDAADAKEEETARLAL